MKALGFVAFLALGLFQIFAVADGLAMWTGLPGFLCFLIAFPLSYVPVLGSIVGVLGAVNAWGWSWIAAGALFFGWAAFALVLTLIAGGLDALSERRRRTA